MTESTEDLYDRHSDRWTRREPILLSDFTARPFVLDWCRVEPGIDALDLGCGEGYVARQLAERGAAVCAIDVSAEMVGRAREQELASPHGIEFAVGDASRIDTAAPQWAGREFDLVVAVFLCNYLDRAATGRVFQTAWQRLRPGGRFVFAVPHPSLPYMRGETRPFYFSRTGHGYFSGRDAQFEGRIWRRDGSAVPVRCVHKTLGDYFALLREAGIRVLPDVEELHVQPEHLELDPEFFGPLEDTPLHLAMRVTKDG